MGEYELRAEHGPGQAAPEAERWHIAPLGRFTALCRRRLDTAADARPLAEAVDLPVRCVCGLCLSVYRGMGARPPLPARGARL